MFEFRDRNLKLNIADTEFEIEAGTKTDKIIARCTAEAAEVVKQCYDGEKTDTEALAAYSGYFAEILCDETAFDKIFANRTPDLWDCIDVMDFIADEVTRFFQKSTLTPIRGGKK